MKWYLPVFAPRVLSRIGWINPAFAFKAYNSEKSTFTMNEAVLDIPGRHRDGERGRHRRGDHGRTQEPVR